MDKWLHQHTYMQISIHTPFSSRRSVGKDEILKTNNTKHPDHCGILYVATVLYLPNQASNFPG